MTITHDHSILKTEVPVSHTHCKFMDNRCPLPVVEWYPRDWKRPIKRSLQ